MFSRRQILTIGLFVLTTAFLWSITTTKPPKIKPQPTDTSKMVSSSHIITGKVVHLAMGEEDCQLDPTYPADKMMLETLDKSLEKSDKALFQFANCQELIEWRRGKQKYLSHIGNYQTARRLKNITVIGQEATTLKQICNNYKKQGAEALHHDASLIEKRLEESFKTLPPNNIKMLGVVHISETLCAIASYQQIQREDQSTANQVILLGVSILNNRLIYTYLLAPYSPEDKVTNLIEKLKLLNETNQSRNNTQPMGDKHKNSDKI